MPSILVVHTNSSHMIMDCEIFDVEVPPSGYAPLTFNATDAHFDARAATAAV